MLSRALGLKNPCGWDVDAVKPSELSSEGCVEGGHLLSITPPDTLVGSLSQTRISQ